MLPFAAMGFPHLLSAEIDRRGAHRHGGTARAIGSPPPAGADADEKGH
jgi:hypothetical protein